MRYAGGDGGEVFDPWEKLTNPALVAHVCPRGADGNSVCIPLLSGVSDASPEDGESSLILTFVPLRFCPAFLGGGRAANDEIER